jgi:hypothetical protein
MWSERTPGASGHPQAQESGADPTHRARPDRDPDRDPDHNRPERANCANCAKRAKRAKRADHAECARPGDRPAGRDAKTLDWGVPLIP